MLSLETPQWLGVIPLLLASYLLIAREWKKQSSRGLYFTGTDVIAEVDKDSKPAKWPIALAAVAPLVIAIGLSGPQLEVTIDRESANVVLVMDTSGSMNATDVTPSRLVAAQNAAKEFLAALPQEWKASLVGFSESPYIVRAPTSNRDDLEQAISTLAAVGGTATGDALDLAIDLGRAGTPGRINQAMADRDLLENPSQTVIVMLSDGRQTAGAQGPESAAARAGRLGIPVFTISFGTDAGQVSLLDADGKMKVLEVPPDPAAMALIASATTGQSFTAISEEELKAVYSSVAAQLQPERDTVYLGNFLGALGLLLGVVAALVLARKRFIP